MALLDSIVDIIPFKKKLRAGGVASTPTFNAQNAQQMLTYPQYRQHLEDIFQDRQSDSSQDLINSWMEHDPDMSSAVNAYLTLANTEMITWVENIEGTIDPEQTKKIHDLIKRISFQVDYTQGFQLKQNLHQINAELRFMLLNRGSIGVELISDKAGIPEGVRNVDMKSVRWFEKQAGVYKPGQVVAGRTDPQMLDQPNFFVAFYRRNPTSIYTNSPFVSSINTISSRTQVINDLYRIMRYTGYPRVDIKIIEEVIRKNAPVEAQIDAAKMKDWVNQQMTDLATVYSTITVDQATVHTDSVEFSILNDKNPGAAMNVTPIIETLNAQNQAGLKTMATILGRGTSGANTGSVESRLASMFADELNWPLVDLYQRMFSFVLHQDGYQGFARVKFRPAEMRPMTELEPQLSLKTARLRQDLSDGIITDVEYAMEIYGRLPNPDAPPLSGSGFLNAVNVEGGGGGPSSNGPPGASTVKRDPKQQDSMTRAATPEKTRATARNRPQPVSR